MPKYSGVSMPNKTALENERATTGTLTGGTGMAAGNPISGLTPDDKVRAGGATTPGGTAGGTSGGAGTSEPFPSFKFNYGGQGGGPNDDAVGRRPYFNMNSDGGRERAEAFGRREKERFANHRYEEARYNAMNDEQKKAYMKRRNNPLGQ